MVNNYMLGRGQIVFKSYRNVQNGINASLSQNIVSNFRSTLMLFTMVSLLKCIIEVRINCVEIKMLSVIKLLINFD